MVVGASTTAISVGAPMRGVMRTTLSGEIRQLDPQKIAIGHVVCAIPPRLSLHAGRFVIGDPVRLTCLGGKLQSVKYAPELPVNQTNGPPGTGNAPTTVPTPQPSCGPACANKVAYTVTTLYMAGSGPTGESSSATGTISDISEGSISAGGLTCSFRPSSTDLMNRAARVGDNVTLTCTGGVFISLKSVGSISR